MDTQTQNLIDDIIKLQNQRNNEHHTILEQEYKHLLKIKQNKDLIIDEKETLVKEKETLEKIIIINQKNLDDNFSGVSNNLELDTQFINLNQAIVKIDKELKLECSSKKKLEAEYESRIFEFDIQKVEKINKIQHELNLSNETLQAININLQNLSLEENNINSKYQEKINTIEIQIDKLQFEFKTYGNVRYNHRHNNIQKLILYQKEYQTKMEVKNKLDLSLQKANTSIRDFEESKKIEYQTLLNAHHQKFQNIGNDDTFQHIYLSCQEEEKKFQRNKKNHYKKMLRHKNLILEELHEIQVKIVNIQQVKKQSLEKHPDSLNKIKEQIKLKNNLTSQLKIEILKIQNLKNIYLNNLEQINSNQKILLSKLEEVKQSFFLNKDILHEILDKSIKNNYLHQEIKYYELEKYNLQRITHKKIEVQKLELENNKSKLKVINEKIKNLEQNLEYLLHQEKITKYKFTKNNQKRLKDTNQKILQELSVLSSIIDI